MDLSFLVKPDTPSKLEIVHADTKEKIGVTFLVLPLNSNAVFSAVSESREKAFIHQVESDSVPGSLLMETVFAQNAAMVVGWESKNPDWDKNVGEYTKEKALAIFRASNSDRSADSITRQVKDFASELENFTQPEEKG